ncbi:hypothetical protein [Actinoplanes philippinensis]|uniref:hypothetical protein n=1 Tax=Actinoplanes philippinensis TaxID=35752 RepID=UPI0033F6345B
MDLFALLVDTSVRRIAEIAADGRRFDRQQVARLADVWDNNTSNFFGVLGIRGRWRRERAARAALRWMGGFGRERYEWMAGVGGDPMRRLLREPVDRRYYRDHAGRVHAGVLPLAAAGLEHDYDLAHARVDGLRIERSGDGFEGSVQVRAPRTFAAGDGEFSLVMPVEGARVDTADLHGLDLSAGHVRIGGGSLRGGPVTVWPSDDQWYLSRAAGQVAAGVPPWRKQVGRRASGVVAQASGNASAASLAFFMSMLHIRRVRYAGHVGRVALERLVEPLAEAGTRAVAASRLRGAAREQAFQRMADAWGEVPDRPRGDDQVPDGAVLTLVSCGGGVLVNFAEPVDGRWPVRAARVHRPGGVLVTCGDGVLRLR